VVISVRIAIILLALFFLPETVIAKEILSSGECGRVVVHSAEDLRRIEAQGDYVLAADIDLEFGEWTPIGCSELAFSGSFDGAGFVIRGLSQSLFGVVDGASFENVKIVGAEISANTFTCDNGNDNAVIGGLTGKATNTHMTNILVSDLCISGADYDFALPQIRAVGGIAGYLENCTVENAVLLNGRFATNAASSGGVAGEIRSGSFVSCGAEFASISGLEAVGGFVGLVHDNAVFKNCYAAAEVRTTGDSSFTAGFAARVNGTEFPDVKTGNLGAEFLRCRAFSYVENDGENSLAGGFVGLLSGRSRVTRSHSTSDIIALDTNGIAGGFVGEITNASRIEFSSSKGAVYGNEVAGGFAGIISAEGAPNTITECLALNKIVAGEGNTRRFAGRADHDGINGCYAYLGMAVIANGKQAHTIPNPFGNDGGDISRTQINAWLASLQSPKSNLCCSQK